METHQSSFRSSAFRHITSFLCLIFGFFLGVNLSISFRLFSLRWGQVDVSEQFVPMDEKISWINSMEKSLITKLDKEVRLLCWVMHNGKEPDRRIAIMKTWGRRCNRIIFVVGNPIGRNVTTKLAENAELVTFRFNDKYEHLWLKTKLAFKYVVRRYKNDFDWVLKVDDDTFVVVENLKLFLKDKDVRSKFYYGFHFKDKGPLKGKRGYVAGGPGYVMSMYSAEKLVGTFSMSECYQGIDLPEDINVAQCLALVGIFAADARDFKERHRFLTSHIRNHLMDMDEYQLEYRAQWINNFSMYDIKEDIECCSDSAISFHQLTPVQIKALEYYIYYVHPFSNNRDIWLYEAVSNNQF